MKKVFTFFLAMAIIFGISGCGKKEYIVFPFSASDVVKIETYYSNSEADTKEKTLTEEADIDYLYTFFSELPVKDANSDSTNDGSTIKFVFDLSDGTNYELVYIGIATKKGYLQSETSDFYYFTSSDIIGVWANLSKMLLTIPNIIMRMEVVKCVLVRECRVYLNYLESDKTIAKHLLTEMRHFLRHQ